MAISRRTLFAKLNPLLSDTLESGTELCRLKKNPYVELVHWLDQLLQQPESELRCILRYFSTDQAQLEADLSRALARLPVGAETVSDFSYLVDRVIEKAWLIASLDDSPARQIRSSHLLMALLSHPDLYRALITLSPVFTTLSVDHIRRDITDILRGSTESQMADAEAVTGSLLTRGELPLAGVLAAYTTDLSAQARAGKLDPVLGRDHEITCLIDILLRRRQNNPLLVGDAGVGKTAIAEGLALAIAAGEVPPPLADVRLLALDIVALTAGAGMKGEFESRLKSVLEAALQSGSPVILFIDEIHTLMGAGGQAGVGDAANLMKPMLARGELRTIGATTWSEFKRYIEKDSALTRRFQVLQIDEPSEASAVRMLRGILPVLEQHHQVLILDEALQAAVRLSHRYIPARQLPDKAISLLDTACARNSVARYAPPAELQRLRFYAQSAARELALSERTACFSARPEERTARLASEIAGYQREADMLKQRWASECQQVAEIHRLRSQLFPEMNQETPELASQRKAQLQQLQNSLSGEQQPLPLVRAEVDAASVAAIVAQWTGIPVDRVIKDDQRVLSELPEQLTRRIQGQGQALQQIVKSICTVRAGLADPQKPAGVFLLTGPSGVGKTETALALAELLYGGEQNLITINMSEYQESHTVSSLKGAPPGYVGYGDGGVLTEAVRRKPYSVVLLDEIEKAHRDVHELFFQIFDKGRLEDGEGRQINFRNTLILLTSNIGSELLSLPENGDDCSGHPPLFSEKLHAELLKYFPAAFLGRVKVIPYFSLSTGTLKNIARSEMEKVSARLAEQKITLIYSDALIEFIHQGLLATSGVRGLIHTIERQVLPAIAGYILGPDYPVSPAEIRIKIDYSPGKGVVVYPAQSLQEEVTE